VPIRQTGQEITATVYVDGFIDEERVVKDVGNPQEQDQSQQRDKEAEFHRRAAAHPPGLLLKVDRCCTSSTFECDRRL
jgi:hypothetical protein